MSIWFNPKKSMPTDMQRHDPMHAKAEMHPKAIDDRRNRKLGIAPKQQIMKHV